MKQMRCLCGKQMLAKLLLPDKLSRGKQTLLFLFTRQPPQFIASPKSQYPLVAVETNMKMRGERGGPSMAGGDESGTAVSLYAGFCAHLCSK